MKASTLSLIVIGVVLLVALLLKGDVKATFKVLGNGFTLETSAK